MLQKILFFYILFFAVPGCMLNGEKEHLISGYDLDKPVKFFMPESLQEISGIAFHRQSSDTIYAIQDEEGRLFRLAWNVKKQLNTKFARSGDYEDLAIVGERVIILKSNGYLFSFPFEEAIYEEPDSVKEWKNLLPKGEYESLYGENETGKIYLLCKNCPEDDSKQLVSGFILQSGDSIYLAGRFDIALQDIIAVTSKVKRGFRPSALAKNTLSNEWYILSAVNKLLVVTDINWKVKEIGILDPETFNQPEGMAFDGQGNLYISNEGDDFSVGRILKFLPRQ